MSEDLITEHTITKRIEALSHTKEFEALLAVLDGHQNIIDALQSNADKDRYWSIDEVAEYIGCSVSTVRRNFITDPRFPRPISSGKYSRQKWLGSEVKKSMILFRQ